MQLFIGNIFQQTAELQEEEAYHFQKVLRGKIGEKIQLTDGNGKMAVGIVNELSSKSVRIELTENPIFISPTPYQLHIAIAPTKNMDRLEFFLEKATEIGIHSISFLKTFHSERKNINLERCQKIVISAVKQSLKAYIPRLNENVKFHDFIQQNHPETKLIAHCDENFERVSFQNKLEAKKDYLILIGPEGDFSKEEIQLAERNNFTGISLGNQRLRTETAALNAVFGVNWVNEI